MTTLTMDEKTAMLVSNALELYARLCIGQFERVADVYHDQENAVHVEAAMARARASLGLPAHGGPGINNPKIPDDARVAFDMSHVIRTTPLGETQCHLGNTKTRLTITKET